ncbi:MAG TPA: BamA/TamA family outer membrane protein [Paludibacteraceae bacterium]|nr:BamA/TamA family outer membrane protein [Paludibacteraceae bacterium]
MRKTERYLCILLVSVFFVGCNTTKFVPEGKYLLDKVDIKTDVRSIKKNELYDYLRQTPNNSAFGLFRTQLGIYSLAGKDTTKWLNRFLMKIGEEPVIFNPTLTDLSAQQLQLCFANKGYLNSKVDTKIEFYDKKARVEYIITSNQPYRIKNYNVQIPHNELAKIANDTLRSLIHRNMLFDIDVLDAERERITSRFRQMGYYNFRKDFLSYTADTTIASHQVDLTLHLNDNLLNPTDSLYSIIFKKFSIRNVTFYINATNISELQENGVTDTINFRNFTMVTPSKQIIRIDALVQNTYINPKSVYNDVDVEKTYSALNSLGAIKYVNISFRETKDSLLDCNIFIMPSSAISLTGEIEATYTDGYWGGAVNLNLINKNIFKGAETFSLQGHGAYEWQKNIWAQEWGGQIGLKFPRFILPFASYDFKRNLHANTEFSGSYYYQFRPGEFRTTNSQIGIKYLWNRSQYQHSINLIDINYVYFPEIFPTFREKFLDTGIFNRYNYENHFIMGIGYSGSTTNYRLSSPLRNFFTMRYNIETAGNFLYGLNHLLGSAPKNGSYQLFNIDYAQYVKTEYNITYHQIFDSNNRFVYHAGIGVGAPYGNGKIIPYEKRFFSGGANSVRGWTESTLGPGVYKRINTLMRDYNQTGDVKLDLNMEYRAKLFWLLEGAAFIDAGNIWTIKDYETQPGGVFQWNNFIDQIAIAYGIGLRFDLTIMIARLDLGIKLHDPVLKRSECWRLPPKWSDLAFHIAIGYPF